MAKAKVNPRFDRFVVISCRGPKALRDRITQLARKADRTPSDFMRVLLTHATKKAKPAA